MKKIYTFLLFTIAFLNVNAQFTGIQWQKALGGSATDIAKAVQQTTDGGYIVAGYTQSNDGDVTFNHGNSDYWVVKLDATGTIQWQKTYGGSDYEEATSIQQTTDGGYIVAGLSESNDGDVTGHHLGFANSDYWVVKLDASGTLQWEKSLGGDDQERAYSIYQTNDGGYVVAGWAYSFNGDVTGHHGVPGDYWVVKLDSSGIIQWQKSLGGSDNDIASSVSQTTDGGYIVAGGAGSTDGDVTGNHFRDYWVVKLDNVGGLQWEKCYGGSSVDGANSIQQTTDGGYIVGGGSASTDGEVTGNHNSFDYWVVKIDSSGTLQWEKSLGGSYNENCTSIHQTTDGGYIVAGGTPSNDGDVTGFHGTAMTTNDCWIVKLNSSGTIIWEEALGGSGNDGASCIQQTSDGGYIMAGGANSNDGDVTGNHGGGDCWIVKLSQYTGVEENTFDNQVGIYPNPSNGVFTVETNGIVGTTISVIDIVGKVVIIHRTLGSNNVIINMSDVEKGIYIVQMQTEKGNENRKIIIE